MTPNLQRFPQLSVTHAGGHIDIGFYDLSNELSNIWQTGRKGEKSNKYMYL